MRIIILPVLVLLSCSTFAAADCRVIEYPDHAEAVCAGAAEQTPASYQRTGQEQTPASYQRTGQEQAVASADTTEQEQLDVPPEMIVRNELANLHAAAWLKTRPGQ
jgi:hypothetical protein